MAVMPRRLHQKQLIYLFTSGRDLLKNGALRPLVANDKTSILFFKAKKAVARRSCSETSSWPQIGGLSCTTSAAEKQLLAHCSQRMKACQKKSVGFFPTSCSFCATKGQGAAAAQKSSTCLTSCFSVLIPQKPPELNPTWDASENNGRKQTWKWFYYSHNLALQASCCWK